MVWCACVLLDIKMSFVLLLYVVFECEWKVYQFISVYVTHHTSNSIEMHH